MNRRHFLSSSLAAIPAISVSAAERKPRVLLRSAWQTVNIGDIGHTPGVLAILEKQLPNVEVRLWPGNIRDGVEPMLRKRFPKLNLVQTATEVKTAFADCDFLLHGSGPSLVAAKQVAEWKEKTGKPFGVFGITVTNLDDTTRDLLSAAKFVFFRDTISLKHAKERGVNCPTLEFGPDGAFAADLKDDETAKAFLAKHELEDGKFLVTIPRLRNTPYWKIRKKEMTDLDRAKAKENEEFQERDHAMVREALIAFARKTKLKVLICPEDVSHMAVGKEHILDKLPDDVRKQFAWRENYWLTDEALSVYRRSLGLLSMDMHSPIMAVGNGIPAIHCRFKQQTSKGQMWNDIGLGEWLFNLDEEKDGTRITKALMAMVENLPVARAKSEKAMEFVRERQKLMTTTLAKCLPS